MTDGRVQDGWAMGVRAPEGRMPEARTPERRALIDFDAAGGVDLDRLERGLALQSERVGHGRFRVRGGAQDHWVDLYSTSHPRCDCGDHLWREQLCKHILAALLREGNDRVVSSLGHLFARLREMPVAA